MTTRTRRTTRSYALMGWLPICIIGIDTETSLLLVEDEEGRHALVKRSALLPLKRVKSVNVQVIIDDDLVSGQIMAISPADCNGNRWAVVEVAGNNVVAHFSHVLVG